MREFTDEVTNLQAAIEKFKESTDVSLSPRLSSIVAILTRHLKTVRDFFELLDHEEALKWMAWHYRHEITSSLVTIRGYLNMLLLGMVKLQISWNPQQEHCLKQAIEHAAALHTTLSDSLLSDLNPYRSKPDTFAITIPPKAAFTPLWSIAKYLLREISPHFVITIQPHLPLIYYDMLYTTSLLERFFAVLSLTPDLTGIIYADLKGEAEFCAISIRAPHLRITPQLWEQMQQSFYYGDEIERLHELGGRIDPLTWDEGQGQGVIVRLPWAKT